MKWVMDLVAAACQMQQAQLTSQVQVLVAKKILNSAKDEGTGALQLLNAASSGIDKAANNMVAAATGLGNQVDVTA